MPRANFNRAAEPAIVRLCYKDRPGMYVGRLVWVRKSGSSNEFFCHPGPMSDAYAEGGNVYTTDGITFAAEGNDVLLEVAEALEARANGLRKLHETGNIPFENEEIQKALSAIAEAVEGDSDPVSASLELANLMLSGTVS